MPKIKCEFCEARVEQKRYDAHLVRRHPETAGETGVYPPAPDPYSRRPKKKKTMKDFADALPPIPREQ
jgi:hypothetical protein